MELSDEGPEPELNQKPTRRRVEDWEQDQSPENTTLNWTDDKLSVELKGNTGMIIGAIAAIGAVAYILTKR